MQLFPQNIHQIWGIFWGICWGIFWNMFCGIFAIPIGRSAKIPQDLCSGNAPKMHQKCTFESKRTGWLPERNLKNLKAFKWAQF